MTKGCKACREFFEAAEDDIVRVSKKCDECGEYHPLIVGGIPPTDEPELIPLTLAQKLWNIGR